MTTSPMLSVIIVSYHSRTDLARCLPTLYREASVSLEILVVDNSPGDGTAAWLAGRFPKVRVIENAENSGYAGGNNLALGRAQGEYVLVLNPDTELQPGALPALLSAARRHGDALIGAKLLDPDGRVNACGNQMHYTGITTCLGLGENPDSFRGTFRVPLVSGAALIASREVWGRLGGFDSDYFMYLEDTELSLRARLLGHDLLCAADATITHHYRLAMSPRKFYFLERNRLLTLMTVLQARSLLRLAPALLLTELATWAYAGLKGPRYLAARWQGYLWLWRHRESWRRKRLRLQSARKIPDTVLLEDSLAALPFDQLVASAPLARALDRLTRPVYRLIRPRSRAGT